VKTIEVSDHEIRLQAMEQMLSSIKSGGTEEWASILVYTTWKDPCSIASGLTVVENLPRKGRIRRLLENRGVSNLGFRQRRSQAALRPGIRGQRSCDDGSSRVACASRMGWSIWTCYDWHDTCRKMAKKSSR